MFHSYFLPRKKWLAFILHGPFFLFLMLLFVAGCSPGEPDITGEWYTSGGSGYSPLSDNDRHMILRFYPKGVYTQFGSSGWAMGRWRMNEAGGYLLLHKEKGSLPLTEEYLRIEQLQDNSLKAGVFYNMPFSEGEKATKIELVKNDNRSSCDPYSPEMQQWRIPSRIEEGETAIQKRTEAYLQFLHCVYQHAVDNRFEHMQTTWYPQPLQMFYSNGIRMAYSTELSDWYPCFYDSAAAVKSYKAISSSLQSVTLQNRDSKFERNLNCIEQLLKLTGK